MLNGEVQGEERTVKRKQREWEAHFPGTVRPLKDLPLGCETLKVVFSKASVSSL
jgi:hypothetical protein